MTNNYWSDINNQAVPSGGRPSPGIKSGKTPAVNEKPAFPTATLPGPTQKKDRSGGVRRVENSPKKMGI